MGSNALSRPLDHLQLCWWQIPSALWTISALCVKGRLILLLLSSKYNSPVTRSAYLLLLCLCVNTKTTVRRQTVGSHGTLFIAFHRNLWPVLACLMKPTPHTGGHWSFFSFHIHLDISVTAHRASPLHPGRDSFPLVGHQICYWEHSALLEWHGSEMSGCAVVHQGKMMSLDVWASVAWKLLCLCACVLLIWGPGKRFSRGQLPSSAITNRFVIGPSLMIYPQT